MAQTRSAATLPRAGRTGGAGILHYLPPGDWALVLVASAAPILLSITASVFAAGTRGSTWYWSAIIPLVGLLVGVLVGYAVFDRQIKARCRDYFRELAGLIAGGTPFAVTLRHLCETATYGYRRRFAGMMLDTMSSGDGLGHVTGMLNSDHKLVRDDQLPELREAEQAGTLPGVIQGIFRATPQEPIAPTQAGPLVLPAGTDEVGPIPKMLYAVCRKTREHGGQCEIVQGDWDEDGETETRVIGRILSQGSWEPAVVTPSYVWEPLLRAARFYAGIDYWKPAPCEGEWLVDLAADENSDAIRHRVSARFEKTDRGERILLDVSRDVEGDGETALDA